MKEEVREVGTRQFLADSFKPHGSFLSDEDYGKVLDNVVPACVDFIVLHREGKRSQLKMLLGKRTREPWPDWFIMGGRMWPGETFEQAAARIIKREIGLDVEASRFQYLGTYAYIYGTRAQPPPENGGHAISITMVLEIDKKEATAIETTEDFSELQWVRPEIVGIQAGLHPALIQYAKDLIEFLKERNK